MSAALTSWSRTRSIPTLHIRRKIKTPDWSATHRPRRGPQDPPAGLRTRPWPNSATVDVEQRYVLEVAVSLERKSTGQCAGATAWSEARRPFQIAERLSWYCIE